MLTTCRLYLRFARIGLMEGLAFRTRTLLHLVSYPLIILANYYLYRAVFAGRPGGQVGGHTLHEAVSYMTIAWIVRSVFWTRLDASLGERVRSGDVAIDLIRPVSFVFSQFCHSLGTSAQRFITITIPLLTVALFVVKAIVPTTAGGWLLLAVSIFLGYILMSATKLLVGLLAFYVEYNENMRFTFEMIQRVLGGLVIPLSFFPDSVFAVLRWLPFQYIYYIPVEVCLGKITDPVEVLLVPILWSAGLVGFIAFAMRRALRKLSIQGG